MDAKAAITEAQGKILDRLAECETAAAQLYTLFSETFADNTAFWTELAKEEHQHARLLLSLHNVLDKGCLFYHIGRFSKERIDTFLRVVKNEARLLKTGRVSKLQSYHAALRVESTLLESGFYECVESDAPAFQHLARAMVQRTEEHRERIRDVLCSTREEHTWDT